MNLNEVKTLLTEVMKCHFKESTSIEDIFIGMSKPYHPEGWKLCIRKSLADKEALCCLSNIVKDFKLSMDDEKTKKGYYIINSK